MTTGNGSPATRAELNALEKLFDAKLKPLADGLDRVEAQYGGISESLRDLNAFMVGVNAARLERTRLSESAHFWVTVTATVFAAVLGVVIGAGFFG